MQLLYVKDAFEIQIASKSLIFQAWSPAIQLEYAIRALEIVKALTSL